MSLNEAVPEVPRSYPLRRLFQDLPLPVIAAPMFLVSGPELLKACCHAGVVGSLAAPNARTVEVLETWLQVIEAEFDQARLQGKEIAPWLFNMIEHNTYDRFAAELELVRRYQPPLVSTALGNPKRLIETVHGYGGQVISDVTTPAMARKALASGVDGLILVCSGAGGHTGLYSPFAFIAEVREFWSGPLGVAGALSSGRDVHAVQVLGADFAVIGTRFIACTQSLASDAYREMLVDCSMDALVSTAAVSGVLANWMRPSLQQAGIEPLSQTAPTVDFSGDIAGANKAWKNVWSAGHGVGQVKQKTSTEQLVNELLKGYQDSLAAYTFQPPKIGANL